MDQIDSKLEIMEGEEWGPSGNGKKQKQSWLSREHAVMMVVAKNQGKAKWRNIFFPWACDLTRKDGELVNYGKVYETLMLEMGTMSEVEDVLQAHRCLFP